MMQQRKSKVHDPKNLLLICLDVLTLLPILEIYKLFLFTSHSHQADPNFEYTKLAPILRCYRIILYFKMLRTSAGFNQLIVLAFGHFIKITLMTQATAAIWFSLGCWKCGAKRTWMVNLEDFVFEPYNPVHWLVICYTTLANVFVQTSAGELDRLGGV